MSQVLLIEPDRALAPTNFDARTYAGHRVQICATAQSAIFCADDIKPDVVILELQLVSHSGIEFLYEFRSYPDWQDIPVVVTTNVPAGEFEGSWKLLRDQLSVNRYLYKPLTSLRSLLLAVNEYSPAK
jgi:DNA-binding response OmpR family regulator